MRCDNGPEFISSTIKRWAAGHSIQLAYIGPGKPWQNGSIESFNSRFCDECFEDMPSTAMSRRLKTAVCPSWRVSWSLRQQVRKRFPLAISQRMTIHGHRESYPTVVPRGQI
ncbi:MAG: hypothetical protein EOO40_01650 [Deltaproteobacteria bacterium]|nr:MAG: hypothetical protein EOO40_01650 [Deltaproteobacteria bacterium]